MKNMKSNYRPKLVIIEDEKLFLNDLVAQIKQCDLPFIISGTAYNAYTGFDLIVREKPDLILSDIRMPGKDGLSLLKEVREIYPYMRYVLISGYMDFNYAKTGITFGVKDYLLKPVDQEELYNCLNAIYEEICNDFYDIQGTNLANQLLGGHTREITRYFQDPELLMMFICVGNSCETTQYIWMTDEYVAELGNIDPEREISQLLLNDTFWIINHTELNKFFLFVETKTISEKPRMLAFRIMKCLVDSCHLPTTVVYSDHKITTNDIHNKSVSMNRIMAEQQIAWASSCIDNASPAINVSSLVILPSEMEKIFHPIIAIEHPLLLRSKLEELLGDQLNHHVTQHNVQVLLAGLISYICYNSQLSNRDVLQNNYDFLISRVAGSRTKGEFIQMFFDTLDSITHDDNENSYSTQQIAQRIAQYIDENYPELENIKQLGNLFYFTPEHLIRIFKKYIGVTPLQYIISKRIDVSKKLLVMRPHIDIQNIAEMVGYKNAHYFSRIFKNVTGFTPSEFREKDQYI
jgi:two-component system response regulator YesN